MPGWKRGLLTASPWLLLLGFGLAQDECGVNELCFDQDPIGTLIVMVLLGGLPSLTFSLLIWYATAPSRANRSDVG